MSTWYTLHVECFTVYCSEKDNEEFSSFDEAVRRAEELRMLYPYSAVEVSALLKA